MACMSAQVWKLSICSVRVSQSYTLPVLFVTVILCVLITLQWYVLEFN